jgi:hypothetical protein
MLFGHRSGTDVGDINDINAIQNGLLYGLPLYPSPIWRQGIGILEGQLLIAILIYSVQPKCPLDT